MKRVLLSSALSLLLGSTLFSPTYYASADSSVDEMTKEEIIEIIDRANEGITDLDIGPTVTKDKRLSIQEDVYGNENQYFTKTFRTVELVEPKEARLLSSPNNDSATYAITSVTAMYDSSKYARADDESYSVAAYSTLYVNIPEIGGVDFWDIERVSGGWNVSDSQVALSNRTILYAQGGEGPNGLPVQGTREVTTSSNAFSYAENSFQPVIADDGGLVGSILSVRTSVDIRDLTNGDTWDLVLENEF